MIRDGSGDTAVRNLISDYVDSDRVDTPQISYTSSLIFGDGGTEDFRFNADAFLSNGLTVTKTGIGDSGTGLSIQQAGIIWASRAGAALGFFNRDTSDGTVFQFGRNKSAVGSISVTGSATAFNTSSDGSLKTDLQPIDPSIIDLIDVYDFKWISDNTRAYGVIAQELDLVLPQAVFKGDNPETDKWSVDYTKLIPLAIAKLHNLESRLATLEA